MIKDINYSIILCILLNLLIGCHNEVQNINMETQYSNEIVFPNHLVPDTNTAVRIAEIILLKQYGKSILRQRPFKVSTELGIDTIWHIKGAFNISNNPKIISMGGVAHISIRSKDCKIVYIDHTK